MNSEAERWLAKKDRVMKRLISAHGPCQLNAHTRYFPSLCKAIISQQLSVKAAATIEKRFRLLLSTPHPTPAEVVMLSDTDLRSVGLSFQKAKYVRTLAQHFLDGSIKPRRFASMSDEEIAAALTKVHGIGQWTAEMFLIFTLHRPDVFSIGDLGLRTAVKNLYDLQDHKEILSLAESWKPHRSVASWYLWRSLESA